MVQHVFLSHDSRDRRLADALGKALQRLTLRQISVWHSSDTSAHGGLKPGHIWLDEIREQLNKSKAVVTLLTPRSMERPWLLFEAGFGAASSERDVIPICVGIDSLASIPFPLGMYQSYQLVDYESVKRFFEKLCAKYDIQFDEEMARPVLTSLIRDLVDASSDAKAITSATPSTSEALRELKSHLDKRFMELADLRADREHPESHATYSVAISVSAFIKGSEDHFIEINPDMSVQNVLDAIYYMLPSMEVFQYLTRWILRESQSNINLVIREIGDRVPARIVFKPDSRWEAIELSKPYSADDSGDHDRWYARP
jgi:hypothetical protein